MNKYFVFGLLMLVVVGFWFVNRSLKEVEPVLIMSETDNASGFDQGESSEQGGLVFDEHPLSIEYMRKQDYPGSEIVVEQTLSSGSNYQRYIVSYKSEGLKQFAMLTIPTGEAPVGGWPAIVFNHGYISPSVYRTTERYVAYLDGFARNGYVVMKPDYRGHSDSEGRATGGYGTPDYTVDVLNAFTSLQKYPEVNSQKIGMWGHSMGGWITQRAMVINPDIKAGVIWAGAVGSYEDLFTEWWGRRRRPTPTISPGPGQRGYWRYQMNNEYGTFQQNKLFWDSISSTTFVSDTSGPIQLHHAEGDSSVPYQLSENFHKFLQDLGLESESLPTSFIIINICRH